jgi:hypothetical protein
MDEMGKLGLVAVLRRPTNTQIQSGDGVGERIGAGCENLSQRRFENEGHATGHLVGHRHRCAKRWEHEPKGIPESIDVASC